MRKKKCKINDSSCVYHACMGDGCQKKQAISNGAKWGAGKCETGSKIKLIMLLLIISSLSCVKDDEPVSTTVRKVYPVEGRYTGSFFMDNDTIGLHWKFKNVLVVCAVDGEQVLIENMKTTAKAWMGTGYYYYDPFWLHGETPCGQAFVAQYRGTGKYGEGWITEIGWFKMTLSGEQIRGNWRSEMVKEGKK